MKESEHESDGFEKRPTPSWVGKESSNFDFVNVGTRVPTRFWMFPCSGYSDQPDAFFPSVSPFMECPPVQTTQGVYCINK